MSTLLFRCLTPKTYLDENPGTFSGVLLPISVCPFLPQLRKERGLHEMNPCLFQPLAGAASTFEPALADPSARHTVSRTISLFRRAVVHWRWSYRLSWVSPAPGFAPPPLGTIIYYYISHIKASISFRCLTPKRKGWVTAR